MPTKASPVRQIPEPLAWLEGQHARDDILTMRPTRSVIKVARENHAPFLDTRDICEELCYVLLRAWLGKRRACLYELEDEYLS